MIFMLLFMMLAGALLGVTSGCDGKVAEGRADGAAVFRQVCARCHGPFGEPNASMVARYGVKNLRSQELQNRLSDAQIRAQILNGSENKQMPSFNGAISDAQITAVIAHVRTLAPPSSKAAPPSSKAAPPSSKAAP